MSAQVQMIERDGKPEYAVVPIDIYRRLLEMAEDVEDVRAYDKAMRELQSGEDELLSSEMAERLMNGENPLRVWREYRGLTQETLAQAIGVGKSYISQIEAGKKPGSAKVLKALATALSLDVDDLLD